MNSISIVEELIEETAEIYLNEVDDIITGLDVFVLKDFNLGVVGYGKSGGTTKRQAASVMQSVKDRLERDIFNEGLDFTLMESDRDRYKELYAIILDYRKVLKAMKNDMWEVAVNRYDSYKERDAFDDYGLATYYNVRDWVDGSVFDMDIFSSLKGCSWNEMENRYNNIKVNFQS